MKDFFEALFGDKNPDDYILLWEKRAEDRDQKQRSGGKSSWFKTPSEAAKYASLSKLVDIYVGVGTSPTNNGPYERCLKNNISGIPGFWLDVDTAHIVHTKANLPSTEQDIEKLLGEFPYKPTISIDSGHGRQFWWLFKEFWHFDSTDEHHRASEMSHRFTAFFRDHAKSLGWGLDMTFDLSRILRIPGTTNYKATPVSVSLLYLDNDLRYTVDDIDEVLPAAQQGLSLEQHTALATGEQSKPQICSDFVLDKNAVPPLDKIEMLKEINLKFKASWEGKRKDFASGKESASEYDMSLAILAFQVNWTWQEVVDLLIAFRRLRGFPPKTTDPNNPNAPLREKYYKETLAKAFDVVEIGKKREAEIQDGKEKIKQFKMLQEERKNEKVARSTEQNIEKVVTRNTQARLQGIVDTGRDLPEEERQKAMTEFIAGILKQPITRIVRYHGDVPLFDIERVDMTINIGPVENLTEQRMLRKKMESLAIPMPLFKKAEWDIVRQAMVQAMVTVKTSEDMTSDGFIYSLVQAYLQERNMSYDRHEAGEHGDPYYENGRVYIISTFFRNWARDIRREPMTFPELSNKLIHFGLETRRENFKMTRSVGRSSYTTYSVYSLPSDHELVEPFIDYLLVQAIEKEEHQEKK
jgi:hypothetical protein